MGFSSATAFTIIAFVFAFSTDDYYIFNEAKGELLFQRKFLTVKRVRRVASVDDIVLIGVGGGVRGLGRGIQSYYMEYFLVLVFGSGKVLRFSNGFGEDDWNKGVSQGVKLAELLGKPFLEGRKEHGRVAKTKPVRSAEDVTFASRGELLARRILRVVGVGIALIILAYYGAAAVQRTVCQ